MNRAAGFHLFAYGTLKSDTAPASARALLRDCERIGTAEVRGTLYDTGRYPALLLVGDDRVSGEVWRCPASLLPVLDGYEGVNDGLFRRVGVRAGEHACWVYVAGPMLGPRLKPEARIPSGSWTG